MLPQIEPHFGPEEREAIYTYMLAGNPWLTEFEKTRQLEQAIAKFIGVKYVSMMPNCTLALYAAFASLGIGKDDEVIVPAFTMIATANAVAMTGAKPVFVDIADNLCIDLELVEQAITDKTRAIVVVSLNGRAPDMYEAMTLAEEYGLYLIEDAAQAFGSQWLGEHLGTFGNMGCYSFSPHKIISTGQGGCIVTDSDEIATKVHRFRNFGRERGEGHDHNHFGINLKFTDLQAVIGLEQMKRLSSRISRKRYMFQLYQELLDGLPVHFVPTDLKQVVPWYVDVMVDDPQTLAASLREKKIGTQLVYPVVPHTGAYESSERFPVAESVAASGIWLPSSVTLADEQIHQICRVIRQFYGGL